MQDGKLTAATSGWADPGAAAVMRARLVLSRSGGRPRDRQVARLDRCRLRSLLKPLLRHCIWPYQSDRVPSPEGRSHMKNALATSLFLLIVQAAVYAQVTTANFYGTVTDPTGGSDTRPPP